MAEKKTKEEREEPRRLTPWRPFGELEPWASLLGEGALSSRFPRLADELFRPWPRPAGTHALVPAMDVSDDEKRYTITVELPGGHKDDVHVELQEGVLTIRGEKRSEREERKERRRYVERSYGAFSRSFPLPSDADADRVAATFENGVLTVTIPKTEKTKTRSIAVE